MTPPIAERKIILFKHQFNVKIDVDYRFFFNQWKCFHYKYICVSQKITRGTWENTSQMGRESCFLPKGYDPSTAQE